MKSLQIFELNIHRARGMVAVHKRAHNRGPTSPDSEKGDVLRAAVVFAVASMDSYFHQKIVETFVTKFKTNKNFGDKYITAIIEAVSDKKRDNNTAVVARKLIDIFRTRNEKLIVGKLETGVRKYIAPKTFQTVKEIEEAFNYFALASGWSKVSAEMRKTKKRIKMDPKRLKKTLSDVVARRNVIVHEADRYSIYKFKGQAREISRTQVQPWLNTIEKFVRALDRLV